MHSLFLLFAGNVSETHGTPSLHFNIPYLFLEEKVWWKEQVAGLGGCLFTSFASCVSLRRDAKLNACISSTFEQHILRNMSERGRGFVTG